MALKGSEKFVAKTLEEHFKKSSHSVCVEEGNDPPDIYLTIDDKKIAVEITDIDQNVLKNAKSINYGYLNLIENLEKELGDSIDDDKKLFIVFYNNHVKVSKINKKFRKYLQDFIEKNELSINDFIEDSIDNVNFKISVLDMPKKGKNKIAGTSTTHAGRSQKSRDISEVNNAIYENDLSMQTLDILENRIDDKNRKCENIVELKWLALYDNYYDKFTNFENDEHLVHYQNIFESITDFKCFEKILVIFKNGDILEFDNQKS
ncbi:hypothetical protein [Sulfurimonas sp. C5]|uniref:hypothetical protein n=1 Tax=Sulfurimonas sp. C5 TaxID=3036947 RepID=UPI002458F414|nr:hypothetical protein [Sulfurimonas sp. C5]MDH4943527.1 hypothetical protein [Sulfurimonas sp. C5]